MSDLTMEARTGDFIVSEANGYLSRDTVAVDNSAGTVTLEAGSVLEGTVAYAGGTATGVLFQGVPAGETVNRTVIVRNAEVSESDLKLVSATALADLAALNIIAR